jgi:hypothetical protein
MSYFFRAEVLTASSAEEIFCLLSSMKEAQQEAVFSLGTGSSCTSYSVSDPDTAFYRSGYSIFQVRIQHLIDPDPAFNRSGSCILQIRIQALSSYTKCNF